jgi:homoserine O-acetyltransferase
MGPANSMPFSRLILARCWQVRPAMPKLARLRTNGRSRAALISSRIFTFGTGETLPELKLHYLTLGQRHTDAAGHTDNAVLLLHGTGGSAHSLLNPVFSDVLFGPGQPLDITKYYIILPDDIGHGESSKPSDGLRMHFPHYDYDDMVASQHTMLVDGLHVDHLRLILGTSMGCMQSFVWGETYPQFSDALAPFACLPVELAGRNRLWRYMAMQMIRNDPAWKNGDYTTEPVEGLRGANDLIIIAGSAPLQMQKNFPTRTLAERYVDRALDALIASTDAKASHPHLAQRTREIPRISCTLPWTRPRVRLSLRKGA